MRWDDELAGLAAVFEDLEQQAAGIHLAERDAEVADRSQAEYARVSLMSRLRASVGETVTIEAVGADPVHGELVRAGRDWVLLESAAGRSEWVVLASAITRASGLSRSAASEAGQQVTARLGLRSVLRGLVDARAEVTLQLRTGTSVRGVLARIGLDFAELVTEEGRSGHRRGLVELLPFEQLSSVRRC